ncbi:unnamed protein product [Cylicostephanus goldi]|uniref:Uncharacterized protein n=1 Tax=Cylicostephanus goldi TaxID=71465 RepID=A0A3P6RYQ8_CYLGO|nr:unnamed protein product [Cylicostephanus goldi]
MQNQGLADKVVQAAEEKIAADTTRIPYQRAGTPEEIAKAILFLADSRGTGTALAWTHSIESFLSTYNDVLCTWIVFGWGSVRTLS